MSNSKIPIIKSDATSAELIKLAETGNQDICKAIAQHPNTSPDLLKKLFCNFPVQVLTNPILDLLLLENPNLFEELCDNCCVFCKDGLPSFFIEWALNQKKTSIRVSLAASSKTPKHILEKLADDENVVVIDTLYYNYLNKNFSSRTRNKIEKRRLKLKNTAKQEDYNYHCWCSIPF